MRPRSTVPSPALLIVDDDGELLADLTQRFAAGGFEVLTARDGGEALEKFEKNRPDLVLLDIRLPRVDGLLVLREILEVEPQADILAMGDRVSERQMKLIVHEGARDFICKPLVIPFLEMKVEQLTGLRR